VKEAYSAITVGYTKCFKHLVVTASLKSWFKNVYVYGLSSQR